MSDLDKLDFSDIAGTKVDRPAAPKPKKEKKMTGTEITVPVPNSLAWICKDLAECSGADFIAWAKQVYPVDISTEEEKLNNSLAYRVKAFKHILNYHATSPFQTGRTGKQNKTEH